MATLLNEPDNCDLDESNHRSDNEGGIYIDEIYVPPPPPTTCSHGPDEVSESRLIIRKIVNTNFKSFGGVTQVGPFHKNFNAIIGPNGSGKSNLIDSLLFVFGYRATKIRSKRLSVLIHKSKKYPNLQSCTVAIHFSEITDKIDEEDKFDEGGDKKIVISRTANIDNTSYYQLNGNKVKFQEIALLLRKHGIDLDHNRFLILQGEVEQISLMKPKAQNEHDVGMLEYLEDIIGTTRFKEPLSKLDEKIECLSELRMEKLNRVKLVEKEKEELQQPMQEAVQFLKTENEITRKKNILYQNDIKGITYKIGDQKMKNVELQKEEETLKETLLKLTNEKKELEKTFKERNKKYDDLMKDKEDLTESFNKANNHDVNLQAEMVEVNSKRKKIKETLNNLKVKLNDMETRPERNKAKIVEYEARETQLVKQYETMEVEKNELLASVREGTIELQERKEQIQTELAEKQKRVNETKSSLTIAESELKLYLSEEQNQKQKFEQLKLTYDENEQKLANLTKQLKQLKQQIPIVEQQLKDTMVNLKRVQSEETRLTQEIKVKRVQVEETRASMQATKSRGRVLDSLMQQKNAGQLPGLFGRLGDLGAIDVKYDVAVSTACGALDNIVVDTVETAQWCIEYLKQNNIGRATFIALEKQEHLRQLATSRIQTPENVARLYDLIRVDDNRVSTAFYFALRDTLVADDIDQATRIAYGARRYRVVTLKGDVIETSGTMSGGGNTVLRGRMGQSVAVRNRKSDAGQIENIVAELDQLETRVNELRQQQDRLERECAQLQTQLPTMKLNADKFTMEIKSLQQQQPLITEQLKDQKQKLKECGSNPAQVKKLENIIDSKRVEYEKAESVSNKMQLNVDKINKEIKDITDKKMKLFLKKFKECEETRDKCRAEIVKLKVDITTSEREVKKTGNKITSLEKEKTDSENRLYEIQAERKNIENAASDLMKKIERISNELNEQEGVAEEKEHLAELTKLINNLKMDHVEIEHKINNLKKKIKELEDHHLRLHSKLRQLKLEKIPDQPQEELRTFTEEELDGYDMKQQEMEMNRDEEFLKAARPNLKAIDEYQKVVATYVQRVNELDEITNKRTEMRNHRDALRTQRHSEFQNGFGIISHKLKEMYQMITLGGDAELEFVDSYDPFSEGVVLNVRPPKKSWKNITNLSGGEKTLTSLALVFALHYYKPSPLYFMDEIDAALDFKNVSIIGNYIKERTKNAQFIIISLRSNMFEMANHLVGIYKADNVTGSVTVDPKKCVEKLLQVK